MKAHAMKLLPAPRASKNVRGACAAISWPVCKRCGLVALRNPATDRALRQPCDGLEDPE